MQKGTSLGNTLDSLTTQCKSVIENGGTHVDVPECERLLQTILEGTKHTKDGADVCWNMYDVRLEDSFPSCGMNWPPDLKQMTPYLRKKEVTDAFNISPDKKSGWVECAGSVSSSFRAKNSAPSITLLPKLLENMPIILFSGDKDLICNHIGTEELIHKMEWSGGKGFETSPGTWAPRYDWVFEGEPAGIYQSARNLTYVLFYNASHMVPFDFPRRTRDMLDRFLGVDIGEIGGSPTDSRIGGEKVTVTSVGGTPNSTLHEQYEKQKLDKARWEAYYHSGEIALIFVATAAVIWGTIICCARRRKARLGKYERLNGTRKRKGKERRMEEADFDEKELDDLTVETPMFDRLRDEEGRYSVGEGSSDEERERKYIERSEAEKGS